MVRAVIFLLVGILLVTFLRMVMGMIFKSMGEMMRPAGTPTPPGRPPVVPASGELKRDPVCGTFVPSNTTFRKVLKGETYHFCSAACRDKYVA